MSQTWPFWLWQWPLEWFNQILLFTVCCHHPGEASDDDGWGGIWKAPLPGGTAELKNAGLLGCGNISRGIFSLANKYILFIYLKPSIIEEVDTTWHKITVVHIIRRHTIIKMGIKEIVIDKGKRLVYTFGIYFTRRSIKQEYTSVTFRKDKGISMVNIHIYVSCPFFSSAVPSGSGAFQMPTCPSSASSSTLRRGRKGQSQKRFSNFLFFWHEAALGWH